jgi:hypothetical protein
MIELERPWGCTDTCFTSSVDDFHLLARVDTAWWSCGLSTGCDDWAFASFDGDVKPDSWWASVLERDALDVSVPRVGGNTKQKGGRL